MLKSDEWVPADNVCGSMGRAEGQSWRKLRIVKATIRSAGSALWRSWCWWHRTAVQEHDWAFASYRTAAKTYKVQESEYRRHLASDEVKSASAVTDDQVSDAKTVQTLA